MISEILSWLDLIGSFFLTGAQMVFGTVIIALIIILMQVISFLLFLLKMLDGDNEDDGEEDTNGV